MKRFLPLVFLVLGLVYLGSTLRPQRDKTDFKLNDLNRVPVLVNGRIKPLDTVARTSLLTLQGRQRLVTPDGRSLTPAEWMADVLFAPGKADTYRCILIENHEVLDLLGVKTDDGDGGKRFSYDQLRLKLPELEKQARLADGVEAPLRTSFQKQVTTVRNRVILYLQLKTSVQMPDSTDFFTELQQFEKALPAGIAAVLAKQRNEPHNAEAVKVMREMADRFSYMEQLGYLRMVPPAAGDPDPTNWRPVGSTLLDAFGSAKINPTVMEYARLGHAWRKGDAAEFNRITLSLHDELAQRFAPEMRKSDVEARFNAAQPFYSSMSLYVLAFLLAVVSWLKWPQELSRAAFWLLTLAWIATTIGVFTRMWIEGRPPVTNLYSSALFVGWGAVLLCLFLEKFFRNGVGSVAGGLIGFGTLIIAHHLSLTGDTMEMMRAVLDSNFWLATHVVIITIGYSATFLAGFLGVFFIFLNLAQSLQGNRPVPLWVILVGSLFLSPVILVTFLMREARRRELLEILPRMVYGIVCFATLFSLVGTVLGGIWADQSWGRFWGWDPKENGALLIVIWNAVVLHARWGGIVRARGLMVMAVFGNIVTSWSWFGTNMLGVGLHSYGFMDSAFYALIAFVASQLLFMVIALVPLEKWRSNTPAAA